MAIRDSTTTVKEEAKNLASEAKNEVAGLASQAKDQVQHLVGERKDRAAEQLGSFAGSLRDAARKLEDGDGGIPALGRYAQTAADQVDRVSQYLRDRDLNAFVRDAFSAISVLARSTSCRSRVVVSSRSSLRSWPMERSSRTACMAHPNLPDGVGSGTGPPGE